MVRLLVYGMITPGPGMIAKLLSIMPQPRLRFMRTSVKAPMTHPQPVPVQFAAGSHTPLARRLAKEVDGEVLFDAASRGRYATDASIYQVMPVGVVVPRSAE